MNNLNFFTNRILAGLVTFPHLVRDLFFFYVLLLNLQSSETFQVSAAAAQ